MLKSRVKYLLPSTLVTLVLFPGCTATPSRLAGPSSPAAASTKPEPAGDDLQAAMDKLQTAIENPPAPFHASFKKSDSDGFSYQCEADISDKGITGQQTDVSPATHIGTDTFPASTRTRELNGVPYKSPQWQTAYGGIVMAYMNGHIRDAQEGVKYAGDEQTGGYDARRYDFDLTGVDATIKRAMALGNHLGMRQTKDYNVKGSAWIAKNDGRMVKFQFDNIMTFNDGTSSTTHYEGAVTKK